MKANEIQICNVLAIVEQTMNSNGYRNFHITDVCDENETLDDSGEFYIHFMNNGKEMDSVVAYDEQLLEDEMHSNGDFAHYCLLFIFETLIYDDAHFSNIRTWVEECGDGDFYSAADTLVRKLHYPVEKVIEKHFSNK